MLGNFYDVFKKSDSNVPLPKSVLSMLSDELPQGYVYEYDKKLGQYHVVPRNTDVPQQFNIVFDSKEIEDFPEWAKTDPNSMMEYLYRTQKKVRIEKVELKSEDGKTYPFSVLRKQPLEQTVEAAEQFLFPSPFPEGKKVLFKTASGKERYITIRRAPYESREFIKMTNTDFPSISLWALYSENGSNASGKFSVSVTPKKAESVEDAVFSLEVLKGYVDGTLELNGVKLGKLFADNPNYDEKQTEDHIRFWNDLLALEHELNVRFDPRVKLLENDYKLLEELAVMYIDNSDCRYKSPVKYITVNKEAVEDIEFRKNVIEEKNGVALSFINGPDSFTLLGAEFELYTSNLLKGISIESVEEIGDVVRLYIESYGNSEWELYKRYSLTKELVYKEQKRMEKVYLSNN